MAFGVDPKALLPAQDDADRSPNQPRGERGVSLDREILLAAEGAAVGDELHSHSVDLGAEDGGDLPLVVVHPLTLGVDGQSIFGGHRERGLGLEKCVLDPLGAEFDLNGVRGACQCLVYVAPFEGADLEEVAIFVNQR